MDALIDILVAACIVLAIGIPAVIFFDKLKKEMDEDEGEDA